MKGQEEGIFCNFHKIERGVDLEIPQNSEESNPPPFLNYIQTDRSLSLSLSLSLCFDLHPNRINPNTQRGRQRQRVRETEDMGDGASRLPSADRENLLSAAPSLPDPEDPIKASTSSQYSGREVSSRSTHIHVRACRYITPIRI